MAVLSRGVRLLLVTNAVGTVLGLVAWTFGVSVPVSLALALLPINMYLGLAFFGTTVLAREEMELPRFPAAAAWVLIATGFLTLWETYSVLHASLFLTGSLAIAVFAFLKWSIRLARTSQKEQTTGHTDPLSDYLAEEAAESIVNTYGTSLIARQELQRDGLDSRGLLLQSYSAPASLLKHSVSEIAAALTIALECSASSDERNVLIASFIELAHFIPDPVFTAALASPGGELAEGVIAAAKRREIDTLVELRRRMSERDCPSPSLSAIVTDLDSILSGLEDLQGA